MIRKFQLLPQFALCLLVLLTAAMSQAQITPSQDAYTNSAMPTKNFGSATVLTVNGATDTTYIQFDLSSIPNGATVSQATLKLYADAITTAGSFNVDYVNGTWSESKITYNLAPALGSAIVSNLSITTADKNQYILINITPAVTAWLNGSQANDGIALVANGTFNASFDSKESTKTSHPAELDIVFAGGGTITGVLTGAGSGLTGGGTTGVLNLGLLGTCAANQILKWSGSAWACANANSGGTVTSVGLSAPGSDFTVSGSPVTTAGTLGLNWLVAPSSADTGNAIVKRDGSGNFSASTITALNINATTVGLNAITGSSSHSSATTILGQATSATGVAWGVEGVTYSSASDAYGVIGYAPSSTGNPIGVYGKALNVNGVGTFGQNGFESAVGTNLSGFGYGAGVWGDGGTLSGGVGDFGTVDDGNAAILENNSPTGFVTLVVQADNSASGIMFEAGNSATNGLCDIDSSGNLNCTGTKNAVVPIDGGARKVALSAIESPVNWFEDAGAGQLVHGVAVVALDPDFIQTVNTEMDYKVFPVPNGDCKGLFVTNKTTTSFEVRELGGGTSSVNFDYRIMALRRKYENVRFADHTNDPDPAKMLARRKAGIARATSHDPTRKTEMLDAAAQMTTGSH